ncbi:metallophosphoesterase [Pelagibius sp. Alg239-R121]|uniref:metallophosphoesterase family protein n=1 Tax=Pelagibius sp. Alg239-R121 TaxID=2993448 RepID=UPI0024A63790|nr:metallophosphoesterase [Pelagibius sp. Alg239-R121]
MPRILHLTDLHLRHHQPGSAEPAIRLSRAMPEMLERLALKLPDLDIDVVVISGDLLDVPDEVIVSGSPDGRAHEDWLAEVERDFGLIRGWLSDTGIDYVVCPGNHDHEPLFRRIFPEAADFVDAAGIRFFCFWDELGSDRQPRRTAARRVLFEDALTLPQHNVPQIHVQHYTIDPPTLSNGAHYEYLDAAEFKRRIDASGRVRAVLSGHYHPGILIQDGAVLYSGPPAFCEAPHRFRVYDLAGDGGFLVENHSVTDPMKESGKT